MGLFNEVIISSSVDRSQRRLVSITSPVGSLGFQVVTVNLYSVQSVTPTVLDSAGGSMVYIEGDGFVKNEFVAPSCRFGKTITAATIMDQQHLRCVAPPEQSSEENVDDCLRQPVEVCLSQRGKWYLFSQSDTGCIVSPICTTLMILRPTVMY